MSFVWHYYFVPSCLSRILPGVAVEVQMKEKPKVEKELSVCPACLDAKYWPFADVAYGSPCSICLGEGKVSPKVATERGW